MRINSKIGSQALCLLLMMLDSFLNFYQIKLQQQLYRAPTIRSICYIDIQSLMHSCVY